MGLFGLFLWTHAGISCGPVVGRVADIRLGWLLRVLEYGVRDNWRQQLVAVGNMGKRRWEKGSTVLRKLGRTDMEAG
jgi:hypothetical protein